MNVLEPLVLVIDEDPGLRRLLRLVLEPNAMRVAEAATRSEALSRARELEPDVVLVDPSGRWMKGTQFVSVLRKKCNAPVLVVAESKREDDKVRALEAGADDYITRPFGSAELVARVRVALRRKAQSPQNSSDSVIAVGDLRIDLSKRLVFANGNEIHLAPLEYKLFGTLMRNAGTVVTHKELLHEVWGPGYENEPEYLHVCVSKLRQKLEKDPRVPQYLITEPAVGYRIRVEA